MDWGYGPTGTQAPGLGGGWSAGWGYIGNAVAGATGVQYANALIAGGYSPIPFAQAPPEKVSATTGEVIPGYVVDLDAAEPTDLSVGSPEETGQALKDLLLADLAEGELASVAKTIKTAPQTAAGEISHPQDRSPPAPVPPPLPSGPTPPAGAPTLLELPVDPTAQGAVRVTLFSTKWEPLAERLVYHGRGQDMKITLAADKKAYAPRDPVKLTLHAADASGRPVKASLGVAVVDDTVLSFADDKSAKILAHLYLEPELGATAADPIEEPNFYFSGKPEAAAAMDALLATRGYRRFEWREIRSQP